MILVQIWSSVGPKLPDFDPLDQQFQTFTTNSTQGFKISGKVALFGSLGQKR